MQLKVRTFNIRYGTAPDGPNSWPQRKNILISCILQCNPDILCLQEALQFQLEEIAAVLPDYQWIGVGRNDGAFDGEFCPIFYKKSISSNFKLINSGTFWLCDEPNRIGCMTFGNNIPRICTWANFSIDSSKILYIANCHLDHESQIAREKSAQLMMNIINSQPRDISIITGDFNNSTERAYEIELLKKNGYVDSFRSIHPNEELTNTYHDWTGRTYGVKIDYIFVKGATTVQVIDAKIDRYCEDGRYPSDHFPVDALLNIE